MTTSVIRLAPKRHKEISLVKSGMRLTTCMVAFSFNSLTLFILGFAFAEVLGILEEIES